MGQRGPKPTPTKLLEMRASRWAKSRPHEPQLPAEKPAMPDFLGDEAKAIWKKLIPQLYKAGLLARIDGWMLARYCIAWVEWQHAGSWLTEYGQSSVVVNAQGNPLRAELWPQARLFLALAAELRRIEQHFGMSPSARAALGQVPQKHQEDGEQHGKDIARFFQRA